MPSGKQSKIRVRILVKAFPQPSRRYEETVCVAAITEDGREMLRLYPVRFRHLPVDKKFDRFDLVELVTEMPKDDARPESRHVIEDFIAILAPGDEVSPESRVRFWKPFIVETLSELETKQKATKKSFGIIKPDEGTVRFFVRPNKEVGSEDQTLVQSAMQQISMFEPALQTLPKPDYAFGYRFKSGGVDHEYLIHDWEVQAAYFNYKKKYGERALDMMKQEYGENIPARNLHFILGNMKAKPWRFIIIGLLRSPIGPEEATRQSDFF